MDLIQATNTTVEIEFGGRKVMARQLKLVEWAEIHAWLKKQLIDPYSRAILKLHELQSEGQIVSQEIRSDALRIAAEQTRHWPPRIGTKEWIKEIECVDFGTIRFVHTALNAFGQTMTLADVEEILKIASADEIEELVLVSYVGGTPIPKPDGASPTPSPRSNGPVPTMTVMTSGG